MRFWISKNSECSVREQLVQQVVLGILSEDLRGGQKLPSVRALARRHRIHPNTVSAAYQYLKQEGWVEARHGSGLYVRKPEGRAKGDWLDQLLRSVLESAKSHGYEGREVLGRLEELTRRREYGRILVIEPEAAMREILEREIAQQVTVPVEAVGAPAECGEEQFTGALVVALPTRALKIREALPGGVECLGLRLRSVEAAIEESARPAADEVVVIVSRSREVRQAARTMLLAVGLSPESLSEIDAAQEGWRDRLTRGRFLVADAAIAQEMPEFCKPHVFRLIADSAVAELRGLSVTVE